jgi:hypothetical protein
MQQPLAIAAALIVGLIGGYVVNLLTADCTGSGVNCRDVKVTNAAVDPIDDIKARVTGSVIKWTITTSGYTFATNGIALPTLPPNTTFTCTHSATIWTCIDEYQISGSGPQTIKYTVNLLNASQQPVPPLDPRIINN